MGQTNINLMQRGEHYFVRKTTKGFFGTKVEYLALIWMPSIDWRESLNQSCVTLDLEQAQRAFDTVSVPDRVIR